jgi:hypothetical protein
MSFSPVSSNVFATLRSVSLNPVSVAAATTASQNFTVANVPGLKGIKLNRPTIVFYDAAPEFADLHIHSARVTAADTLTIVFTNSNAGSARDAAAAVFNVVQF